MNAPVSRPLAQARTMSSHADPKVEPILVPVKMRPELRKRFRVSAVSKDMTYAQLIEHWLDLEDAELAKKRARQAHPLHRP